VTALRLWLIKVIKNEDDPAVDLFSQSVLDGYETQRYGHKGTHVTMEVWRKSTSKTEPN